jgi:uncharacterized protein (DUF1330 family)
MGATGYSYIVISVLKDIDDGAFAIYGERATESIVEHGGAVLNLADVSHRFEGMDVDRAVVIGFPSEQAARTWYLSDQYQELVALRHSSATTITLFGGQDLVTG